MADGVEQGDEKTPVENFNDGFLEGIGNGPDSEADPLDFEDKPAATAEEDTAAEKEGGNEDQGDDAGEDEKTAAEKTAAEKTPEPEPTPAKDHSAEIYDMLDKRLPKEQPLDQQPAAKQPEEKKEAEPEKPALTEEEVARLKELNTEWKDVSEMVSLQIKTVQDSIAKEVAKQVTEIKGEFEKRLQPVQQSVEMSAAERYDSAVREAHPEVYDPKASKAFGDELVKWVQEQPAYLRQAYSQAFESPDPQDAIDLIARFKKETGKVTEESEGESEQTPAKAAESAEKPTESADKGGKDKKLQLMAAPTSRRTKGAESDDPLDFSGGFKEMVREMERAG